MPRGGCLAAGHASQPATGARTWDTERRYIVSSFSCSLIRSATAPAAQAGVQAVLQRPSPNVGAQEFGAGLTPQTGPPEQQGGASCDHPRACRRSHAHTTHAACGGRGHVRQTAPLRACTSPPAALRARAAEAGQSVQRLATGSRKWDASRACAVWLRELDEHPCQPCKPGPRLPPRRPPAPAARASPAAACTSGTLARCACCSTSATSPAAAARRAADSARYSSLHANRWKTRAGKASLRAVEPSTHAFLRCNARNGVPCQRAPGVRLRHARHARPAWRASGHGRLTAALAPAAPAARRAAWAPHPPRPCTGAVGETRCSGL